MEGTQMLGNDADFPDLYALLGLCKIIIFSQYTHIAGLGETVEGKKHTFALLLVLFHFNPLLTPFFIPGLLLSQTLSFFQVI